MNFQHLSKFILLFFLSVTLFNACTKDDLLEVEEVTTDIDLSDQMPTEFYLGNNNETANTRSSCEVRICADFTGSGDFELTFPNRPTVFINLETQSGTVNGFPFAIEDNQYCETVTISGGSTTSLAFEGTGSVVATVTYASTGASFEIFSAGVGTNSNVTETKNVRLKCPINQTEPANECEIEICAYFTGKGIYRLALPNGTVVRVDPGNQTVTINGNTFPLQNNRLCQTLFFNGPVTADVRFKGTGSVQIIGTWLDGEECTVFEAGVNGPSGSGTIEDVELDCEPPC